MNYDALCRYAGTYLDERSPEPVAIGRGETVPDIRVAVYVAVGVDGTVLYVGSVVRPQNPVGVRSRLEEHLRKQERFETWDQLFLVPLKVDTPLGEVRRVEARIGAHLRPSRSRALPRLRRPG